MLRVDVEVSRRVRELEHRVRRGVRPTVRGTAEGVRDRARRNLGASRRVGPSLTVLDTGASAELRSRHPGVRALNRGATIVPRLRRVLRFQRGGETVYTRGPVRIRAKRFLDRAVAQKTEIARDVARDVYRRELR